MKSNLDHAPKETKPTSSIREDLRKLGVRSCNIGYPPYISLNLAFLANPWPGVFTVKTDPEGTPIPAQYLSNYFTIQRVRVEALDHLYFSLLFTIPAFSFSLTFVRPSMLPSLIRAHRKALREAKAKSKVVAPKGIDPSRN